jgi:hypothetical protein
MTLEQLKAKLIEFGVPAERIHSYKSKYSDVIKIPSKSKRYLFTIFIIGDCLDVYFNDKQELNKVSYFFIVGTECLYDNTPNELESLIKQYINL